MAEEKTPEAAPAEDAPTGETRGTFIDPSNNLSDWGQTTRIVEKHEDAPVEDDKDETGTEEAPAAEVEVVEEAPAPAVEDPGEYRAKDYSFEVTVYDAEGKNGRTRKVSSVDQWDQLLEADPNFGNATALLKAQRLATKMESGLERDRESYDARKTEFDNYRQTEQDRTAATERIANEISYLVDRGELPKVAAPYVNANWNDPEVAKQPGVREQIALLSYMASENNRRTRNGLQPITSALDAWNAYQLDESRKNTETRKTEAAEQRKAAGARVAGVASNPTTTAPRGIMIGRAGSLSDLGADNWEV